MGERVMPVEAEQHAERPRGDLRVQPAAGGVRGRRDVQLLAPEIRGGVDLDHAERDRAVDLSAQPLHPLQLFLRGDDVFAGHALRSQLEYRLTAGGHRPAQPEKLIFRGIGSRYRFTVDGAVTNRARSRKAQRPSLDRFLHQPRHRRDVVG